VLAAVLASSVLLTLPHAGTAAGPEFDAVVGGAPVGTPRVIGGDLAVQGRWPSVVALARAGSGSPADRQFCGATVIAPRWVMTAAHCLYDAFRREVQPSDIRVIAGVSDLRADPSRESTVVSLFIHPEYDHVAQDAYDDIALLEVANALDAPAVSLFGGDTEALGAVPGVVVGWGATEFSTPSRATYPDALHDAVVPLVSRETCNDPMSYAGYIGSGQLCAGFVQGGVDTCVGDSGGPLFVDTGELIEQVGVVSYGRGCAEPFFYGIYTNVSAYRGWIGQFVELPELPSVAVDPVESPRGPSVGGDVLPAEAPVARPDPGPESPQAQLPSGSGGPFGGAAGLPGLLALAGLALVRRRRTIP